MSSREGSQTPPHEYYIDLIKRSPKVTTSELTPFEREHGHQQFGNNFYMLFLTRQLVERSPEEAERDNSNIVQAYLRKAEGKYGEHWREFLQKNRELIEEIDKALDGIEPYYELVTHYRDLLRAETGRWNYEVADAFGALDFEAVGVYAWRQLNPLLKKAAKQMKREGINPRDFCP